MRKREDIFNYIENKRAKFVNRNGKENIKQIMKIFKVNEEIAKEEYLKWKKTYIKLRGKGNL